MKTFKVKLRGTTPLMHHRMTEEEIQKLLGTKTEKKKDKEVLTPREIAEKHVYKDSEGDFAIPTMYLIGAVKSVASEYKQKNSQRKSLKSIAAGIIRPKAEYSKLTWNGKKVKDFEVDIRKATNHKAGAVAVCRPRFDEWETELELDINTDLISAEKCLEVINDSGIRSGIGSFRVSKGGYFGQFVCTEFKEVHVL